MTSGSPRASSLHPVCLSEPHHKSKCCSHTLISRLALDHSLYAGHDKPVSSVSWSLNRQWWLSASEDQSLRIWTLGSAEPAIILVKLPFLYKHAHLMILKVTHTHAHIHMLLCAHIFARTHTHSLSLSDKEHCVQKQPCWGEISSHVWSPLLQSHARRCTHTPSHTLFDIKQ